MILGAASNNNLIRTDGNPSIILMNHLKKLFTVHEKY